MKDSDKIALITGITGQDGSYLAELLLEKGTQSTELCGARAICCDLASSISDATKKFTIDDYFCTMGTSPIARLCVALLAMFDQQSSTILPGKAMLV
jgi:hypothetical protein